MQTLSAMNKMSLGFTVLSIIKVKETPQDCQDKEFLNQGAF
jgi:hypothetical protein